MRNTIMRHDHYQEDRDFSMWHCDCCRSDVTHRLPAAARANWTKADDYAVPCPDCGQKAVHQTGFNVDANATNILSFAPGTQVEFRDGTTPSDIGTVIEDGNPFVLVEFPDETVDINAGWLHEVNGLPPRN